MIIFIEIKVYLYAKNSIWDNKQLEKGIEILGDIVCEQEMEIKSILMYSIISTNISERAETLLNDGIQTINHLKKEE